MELESKLKIAILILIVALFFIVIPFTMYLNQSITGDVIKTSESKIYSYTKAICNESNYCQDYEIKCSGNKTIEIKPITSATIQFSKDCKDPRNKEIIQKLCE